MILTRRPLPFVLAASHHGMMIVNRNDYKDTPEGRYGVGHQVLEYASFDPAEVDDVLQLLDMRHEFFGDGLVAIDGGANIGVHTLEWARHMQGWGKVVAFEAQERVFYALAGNIALNNCFNATAHYAALGSQEGSITVPMLDYGQPSSFGSLELRKKSQNEFIGQDIDYSEAAGKKVRMMTIDGLDLPRLDFVKLDIEGMEIEALTGALQALQKHKPMMVIEVIKSNRSDLTQLLERCGYTTRPMGVNIIALHLTDPALARLDSTP